MRRFVKLEAQIDAFAAQEAAKGRDSAFYPYNSGPDDLYSHFDDYQVRDLVRKYARQFMLSLPVPS